MQQDIPNVMKDAIERSWKPTSLWDNHPAHDNKFQEKYEIGQKK
jgi:hypothetical protein